MGTPWRQGRPGAWAPGRPSPWWVGWRLAGQRFGVIVVGIRRASGAMEFNPAPESTMLAGDHLVVLGKAASLRGLEAAAGSPREPVNLVNP